MNKVVSSVITIILVLSFAMGIYCAGTNKTYDFFTHLQAISMVTEEMPTIEELGFIWNADIVENGRMGAGPMGSYRETIHLKRWPNAGPFKALYDENTGAYWYPFVGRAILVGGDEDEFWTPVGNFLDGVEQFTSRTVYTFLWLGQYATSFFELVFTLSPTSGIVERGVI